ncbi:MAG TPA: hypothetical protein VF544_21320 [Pyrinomonadaceae bacterium]|jgi:hypothetical protein
MSIYLITTIVYATIILIFPIVPAYLLYRALPAGRKTKVSGPWKGLSIQLTGAFAGYFLLFITMSGFILMRPEPPDKEYKVWEVTGKVALDGKNSYKQNDFRISTLPASINIQHDGKFTMAVVAQGSARLPIIKFEGDGYEPRDVDLEDVPKPDAQLIPKGRPPLITLGETVFLPRETQLNLANAQAPQEISLQQGGK